MLFSRSIPFGSANPGDVVRFDYLQPVQGPMSRIGRVASVRDCHKQPVAWSRYRLFDPMFRRSQFLVTVSDGDTGFKQFYGDPRSQNVRRYNLLGKLWLKLTGKF